MNKTIEIFELAPEQIKLKHVLTQDFLELEINAISNDYPNRNNSYFNIECMKEAMPSFYNKPILGFFKNGDFISHNGTWKKDNETGEDYFDTENGERILGLIRESDKVEIIEENKKTWIKFTCVLYVQYVFQEVKKILKDKKKKVSVEIEVLEKHVDEKGIVCIDKFKLMGVTILGSRNGILITEGIEGASLSILNFMEKSIADKQQQALCFAYGKLENKGAEQKNIMEEEEKQIMDENEIIFSINKSKEVISYNILGETNSYIEEIKKAKNFSEFVADVFLDLQDTWEKDNSKMKYPVMELKNNELVYNFNALIIAKYCAEIAKNINVLEKLKVIYTSLGLDFKTEENNNLYDMLCGKQELILEIEQSKKKQEEMSISFVAETEKFTNLKKDYDLFKEGNEKNILDLNIVHQTELEKFSDYEKIKIDYEKNKTDLEKTKSDFESTKKELSILNCRIRASEAKFLMEDSFSKEESEKIIKKCQEGYYSTYEQLKQEIGLILLEQKTKNKKYQLDMSIINPIEVIKTKEEASNLDKLKKYINK